jgi:Cu/Ag efflux protein CusF
MRKTVALVMALFVACAVVSFATAAQKKGGAKAPTAKHVTGEVVSVDATAKTITVKGKDKDLTFTLADNAKVMVQGKAGSLDQLKAGDHVSVKFEEKDGAEIAQEIHTSKAPAKKG